MPEYGLTRNGPNIKRLDVILDDMHTKLSKKLAVNTKQNPQSVLNHILTNVADSIAELWEFGEDVYYSQYPSTAEGDSLDAAAQFGGSVREHAAKSYYPIHCTGVEGTVLSAGTMLASTTNPVTRLTLAASKTINRGAFNKAAVKVVAAETNGVYTVALDNKVYTYVATEGTELEILNGLKDAIADEAFTVSLDEEKLVLFVESADLLLTHAMILSANLTTETVTSVITFGTTETGDIQIPDGAITEIVQANIGLQSVVNCCGYIAGRDKESDTEFRQSYADKIYSRSSRMLESIRSAILNNVQGVKSVAPYENCTNDYDDQGRPPHSIEIVVEGGDANEIAQQILNKKAGGINTYGDTVVEIAGEYDEDIVIRFNRPTTIYTWYKLALTLKTNESLPTNYIDLLRGVITKKMDEMKAGQDVIPQEFMSDLYKACSGIAYIDISIFSTESKAATPDSYPSRSVSVAARAKAFTSAEMIEVVING